MALMRSLALRYGRTNRRRKAAFVREFVRRHGVRTVLIVGAGKVRNPVDGIVERELLDGAVDVVVSGLVDVAGVWPNYVCADGLSLPFADREFDLVFSNAVIEHVGGEAEQRRFIQEHDRVGQHWIATTPNRWFPVESHRHQLFRHWSPTWSDPHDSVTRLLSVRTFAEVLPRGEVVGRAWSPTLIAVSTVRASRGDA